MTLGDYLKQQRTEQDFSQAELAEKMGVEQSYLSKLEGERSLPSAEILAAWRRNLAMARWQNTLLQALGLFLGTFGLVLLMLLLRTQKR